MDIWEVVLYGDDQVNFVNKKACRIQSVKRMSLYKVLLVVDPENPLVNSNMWMKETNAL